jgi:hypothetical protein
MAIKYTIPTDEAGDDWLECLEYTGPGAKDPTGGKTPQGWNVTDLIKTAVVFRKGKAVEIDSDTVKKGDKLVKVIMNEELIKELYDDDPEAILLTDAKGRMIYDRLTWYQTFGRDGLRVWATGRLRMKIMGGGVHT